VKKAIGARAGEILVDGSSKREQPYGRENQMEGLLKTDKKALNPKK